LRAHGLPAGGERVCKFGDVLYQCSKRLLTLDPLVHAGSHVEELVSIPHGYGWYVVRSLPCKPAGEALRCGALLRASWRYASGFGSHGHTPTASGRTFEAWNGAMGKRGEVHPGRPSGESPVVQGSTAQQSLKPSSVSGRFEGWPVGLALQGGRDPAVPAEGGYLVDPASSHMLVSKIKPCMSKYKLFIL